MINGSLTTFASISEAKGSLFAVQSLDSGKDHFYAARKIFINPEGPSDCDCCDTDLSSSARHPKRPSIFSATGRGAHRPRNLGRPIGVMGH